MASAQVNTNFLNQIKVTRKSIQDSFKKSHEALRVRESNLLSRVDEIEKEYNSKTEEMKELLGYLNNIKSISSNTLKSNKVKDIREEFHDSIERKIAELTADIDSSIEFEWDSLFETDIEQLGSIKLNGQINTSPTRTFSPQVKPVVPDYRAKQLPTAYCCKKSSEQKAPGEMYSPRCITVHYKTGNIYIADACNHRVQVFTCNGDYLFMFNEKMNHPLGICITHNRVLVTQCSGNCITMYELEGKLIKSVGSEGNGEAQFNGPRGLAVSDKTNNVYVCDYSNNRIQIFTEDLKFHSMLGIGVFYQPRDIKVIRDRVLVLDENNPCMFVFNSNHVLTNRLITRGDGKQTNYPVCFDIDREYNIIMSDYSNHCVYVFNQEGEEIHRIGKKGQGIGEFINPYGIVLDNTGRIVVACQKDIACLQFF